MAKRPDKDKLVAYVDDLYFRGNQSRWMYMIQWWQNYHFLVGHQWIEYKGAEKLWQPTAEVEGRIQYTSNKILPAARMNIGRMIKDNKQQLVIHATNDEKSIDTAKAATRFLEYLWRKDHGKRTLKEVANWSLISGMGIAKYYVDLDKGPERKTSKQKDGEICIDVLSPFEFVVPPNARYMEKLPWAMHARMETKEYVFEKWGVEIESAGTGDQWAMYQAANINVTEDGAFVSANMMFDKDTILVKELWIRPCKEWKNGRVIIIAGDQVVHNEDIPWDKDYWPFNWLPYGDVPFRFWQMSMVESMIDPQKAINTMSSNILENIRYMGNGVILAPMGSVEPDDLVAEPGAIWPFNAQMGEPKIIAQNPVPTEVFTEKSSLESEIYDLAGIHMLGSGMSGLRAAAAIMLVEQQDETAFESVSENVDAFLKRDAEMKLFLAQKAFNVPRKVKILGEEGQWQVTEFNASDLCGEEEIVIQSKQEFANDKATRFNQIGQLLSWKDENGKPIADRHTALQLLDMAGLDGATTEYDLDFNLAKYENEEMLAAKEKGDNQFPVNDFDDHAVHIQIHNQERKRIGFRKLPKWQQDLFTLHVQAHQNMLQQQSPMQTAAKGDEQVQPQQPMQPNMPMGNPLAGQPPQVPGFNAANALQRGVDATHNLIATGGRQF